MTKTLLSILAPLVTISILMLGQGFYLTFVSVYFDYLGHSEKIIGYVHSAYYAGMLLGGIKAESVINRVGHIRAYAAYCGVGTACIMLQGLSTDPILWVVTRLMMGFSIAVYYIVIESWFLAESTPKTRGLILGVYMIALYSSQALGQFILDFVDIRTAQAFLLAGMIGALSAVPLTLTSSVAPEVKEPSLRTFGSLAKESVFGFSGCVIAGILLSSIYSFFPVFARDVGVSVSLLMSTVILGGVVLQWPLGRLSDYLDRRRVLFGVALSLSLPATALFFTYSSFLIWPLAFILGGLAFTLYPLSIGQVCDRLQPHDITKATAHLLVAYGIGAVVGPLLAPYFLDALQPTGLLAFVIVNSLLISCIGLYSFAKRAPVPMEEQSDFVSLPRVTPVAYELDPRVEE